MDFYLCGAILNLKAFCFGAIPHIMIELIVYESVPQSRQAWQWLSGIETKVLGASGYWQKKELKMDSCLRCAILNLKAFCFGAIPHIMIELIVYESVPQSRQAWQWLNGIEAKLLGGFWFLVKTMFKMDSCLRGAILNLTAFCSIWTLIENVVAIDRNLLEELYSSSPCICREASI